LQQQITISLAPHEAHSADAVKEQIGQYLAVDPSSVSGFITLKKSIDSRSRQPRIRLSVNAFINEPFTGREIENIIFPDVSGSDKKAIVVGAGPAGLFAALRLIEKGIRPIVIERGKDVRSRRRDLARLNKEGVINPESNYCFGEGGAGAYSDGKLYTRSKKRGDVNRILNLFVQFGAQENILYDAHPHIGTNKLPHIITAIRKQIIDCGGAVLFEKKLNDLIIKNNTLSAVIVNDGERFEADAFILATGHSARDIFMLLHSKKILIESKPFAMGVRIEHPQQLIDRIQYHCPVREAALPPAAYSVVEQVGGRGVFSFCMCPGGIIAPASTAPNELVVNGWSPSKRNNPFANSGIVVSVEDKDIAPLKKIHGPLAAMYFQQAVEQKAFKAGGGLFVAPAQRMADFTRRKRSDSLPGCSYLPGIRSALLHEILPPFIYSSLQKAFLQFGEKMKGYYTNEALVLATESRTSSPVRIPRDSITLQHPQIQRLYPCGEGAGYAGGIVSAAMDGEKIADAISQHILNQQ